MLHYCGKYGYWTDYSGYQPWKYKKIINNENWEEKQWKNMRVLISTSFTLRVNWCSIQFKHGIKKNI